MFLECFQKVENDSICPEKIHKKREKYKIWKQPWQLLQHKENKNKGIEKYTSKMVTGIPLSFCGSTYESVQFNVNREAISALPKLSN